jgi:hypothetical protein
VKAVTGLRVQTVYSPSVPSMMILILVGVQGHRTALCIDFVMSLIWHGLQHGLWRGVAPLHLQVALIDPGSSTSSTAQGLGQLPCAHSLRAATSSNAAETQDGVLVQSDACDVMGLGDYVHFCRIHGVWRPGQGLHGPRATDSAACMHECHEATTFSPPKS